jgi:pimeloyl-ACP methyl ester carboxylesterase/predicted glycosyltransferase
VRASVPVESGFAQRDGVRIAYDVYGSGEQTLLFVPPWSIVHSRCWKAQVPYFSRSFRVVTYDGRGNGKSDKSADLDYSDEACAADLLAVMDATRTATATLVTLSAGSVWGLMIAARHPERVERLICVGPAVGLAPAHPKRAQAFARFEEVLQTHDGWEKYNKHYWESHYRDFIEFFFSQCLPEPHSTKQFEDCVEWGLETTAQTLAATVVAPKIPPDDLRELCGRVRCPVLVFHGEDDRIIPTAYGRELAAITNARFIGLPGSGHLPQARIPVRVNVEIADFLDPSPPTKSLGSRKKRALFLSSPIGLGHAQRDVAISDELRKLCPDLEIEWLAQHPVTEVLRARKERVHPASAQLTSESAHFESECGEHDLHAFQAIRRMDEILVSNFMVLYDLLREERFDVVVGDEAWDVDHFLHEHPNKKRAPFVWMTDFVGWIPMPDGGAYEERIAADYNAEMIEHVERHPQIRDRSIFVGDPDDIVPLAFGPGLPPIRTWTQAHYEFPGYVTGFTPPSEQERAELRERFGFSPDQRVCIVAVGGSGVGDSLIRRILHAYPAVRKKVPGLRTIVVTGPRLDPRAFAAADGLEVVGYVPELYRRLSVCDIAVVQGGLTTTMELTTANRPFIYVPLEHHFEQNVHVRHRLQRHGAGKCMRFHEITPDALGQALAEELDRKPHYAPVPTDGAARAARLIADVVGD